MKKYIFSILYYGLIMAGMSVPSHAVECPRFNTEEELRDFEDVVGGGVQDSDKVIFRYLDRWWFMPTEDAKIIENKGSKHEQSHLKSITFKKQESVPATATITPRMRCYYEQTRESTSQGEFKLDLRMTVVLPQQSAEK